MSREADKRSETKSSDHLWFGPCGIAPLGSMLRMRLPGSDERTRPNDAFSPAALAHAQPLFAVDPVERYTLQTIPRIVCLTGFDPVHLPALAAEQQVQPPLSWFASKPLPGSG